jgi:hypothetical protein
VSQRTVAARVILVGGAPMSGKSTVARVLAERRRYALIATDDLGAAVRADRAARSALASPPPEDHREYYVVRSVDQLWQEALVGHQALAPAIDAVVRMHATWAQPAIIEGWALLPERLGHLAPEVAAVWLLAGRDLLEARVRADTAFWAGASDTEAMITKFVARSLRFNEQLCDAGKTRPLRLVHVSGGESPGTVADRIEERLAEASA